MNNFEVPGILYGPTSDESGYHVLWASKDLSVEKQKDLCEKINNVGQPFGDCPKKFLLWLKDQDGRVALYAKINEDNARPNAYEYLVVYLNKEICDLIKWNPWNVCWKDWQKTQKNNVLLSFENSSLQNLNISVLLLDCWLQFKKTRNPQVLRSPVEQSDNFKMLYSLLNAEEKKTFTFSTYGFGNSTNIDIATIAGKEEDQSIPAIIPKKTTHSGLKLAIVITATFFLGIMVGVFGDKEFNPFITNSMSETEKKTGKKEKIREKSSEEGKLDSAKNIYQDEKNKLKKFVDILIDKDLSASPGRESITIFLLNMDKEKKHFAQWKKFFSRLNKYFKKETKNENQ